MEIYVAWTDSWVWTSEEGPLFSGQPVEEEGPWWACLYIVSALHICDFSMLKLSQLWFKNVWEQMDLYSPMNRLVFWVFIPSTMLY